MQIQIIRRTFHTILSYFFYGDYVNMSQILDVVIRYINEDGIEEKAILTIDENGDFLVKPYSDSTSTPSPASMIESEKKETIPAVSLVIDPVEKLVKQINDALTQLAISTSQ